jgi:itaconyl-CoA hydratase
MTVRSEGPRGYRQLGGNRYRENVGFGYDEFVVGTVIEHRPGRTVTETDNVVITTLTGNCAPIHLDAEYAAGTQWGRTLVCSLATLAIVGGMTVRSTSGLTVANLGWRHITLSAPVFVGDTLTAETRILHKRLCRTRPHLGIVTCRTDGFNQAGECVVSYERSFFVPIDAQATRTHFNY